MPKRTLDHRAWLIEELRDPVVAANYLNEAMSDSIEMFLKALRNVAQARQMTEVAKKAGVRRESLYRTLSKKGNPCLDTLNSILNVVGLRISFQAQGISPLQGGYPANQKTIYVAKLRAPAGIISGRSADNIPLGGSGSGILKITETLTTANNAASIGSLQLGGSSHYSGSFSGFYSASNAADISNQIAYCGATSGIMPSTVEEPKEQGDYSTVPAYCQQLPTPENPMDKLVANQTIEEAT